MCRISSRFHARMGARVIALDVVMDILVRSRQISSINTNNYNTLKCVVIIYINNHDVLKYLYTFLICVITKIEFIFNLVLRMLIRVAKRNTSIAHRKQRDYPWKDLAEFLDGDTTPDGSLVGLNAPIIQDIIQARFAELWDNKVPEHTKIKDYVPYNGFHKSYVLSVLTYLEQMNDAEEFHNKILQAYADQNHEFFGSEEYISRKQNVLVVRMDIPAFDISFTFMLRPFIFDGQSEDELMHAGSMYVHTRNNAEGWFYQFKYVI
jgi:hypothetical protein